MDDLWPNDISETSLKAPGTILKQQAAFLGSKTNNLIEAKVEAKVETNPLPRYAGALLSKNWVEAALGEESSDQPERVNQFFVHSFYIAAPTLDYRYKLFSIQNPIDFYPVTFRLDIDIKNEILGNSDFSDEVFANNEQDFITVLSWILQSEKTKRVVHALLAQLSTSDIEVA